MSNKIKISTAEFCLEGAFTGTITLPNPEYDFGGFLDEKRLENKFYKVLTF